MALNEALSHRGVAYIYYVHTDSGTIDLAATFGDYSPEWEDRLARFGQVRFDQIYGWIYGWIKVDGNYSGLRPNPDFDRHAYSFESDQGAVPGLAGFPKSSDAWREEPWKHVKCTFNANSTQADAQRTCRPDDKYAKIVEGFPKGALGRLRDGKEESRDCSYFRDVLINLLPEYEEKALRYTGNHAQPYAQSSAYFKGGMTVQEGPLTTDKSS